MFKQQLILAIALFFNNNFTTSIVYKQKKVLLFSNLKALYFLYRIMHR